METAVSRATPLPKWPVVLLGGTVGGALWGVFARLWMRFITTDPEFTWEGTAYIVGGFAVVGLVQAAVQRTRRTGLRRRLLTPIRVLGTLSLLLLAFGAGGALVPTVVFGALAVAHGDWSIRVRTGLALMALLYVAVVAVDLFADLSLWRAAAGTLWMIVIYLALIWAATASLGPQLDGWRAPRWLYSLGGLLVLGVVGLTGPILLGAA